MNSLDLITLGAAGVTFFGVIVSIGALALRIGRWQAKSEERGASIMRELVRMNGSVTRAHDRIDSHLEVHV